MLGPYDRFAKLLRQALDIEVYARHGNLKIKGDDSSVEEARRRIEHLLGKARKGPELSVRQIERILLAKGELEPKRDSAPSAHSSGSGSPHRAGGRKKSSGHFKVAPVEPRNESQKRYLDLISKRPLVFGIGAAGTGKTFLAVAAAARMLRQGLVRRLIITRPVVEAGERLGFLPGDLHEKLDPYMRPIYDALYTLIDGDEILRLEEAGVIEIAPLAYMRGRTLSNAFVILDEAQNTTIGQMKMFLTRMGEGSVVVVTGDASQNDLPQGVRSGLGDAVQRLRGFEGVGVSEFSADEVVRHPLVAQIVRAYQAPARTAQDGGADG